MHRLLRLERSLIRSKHRYYHATAQREILPILVGVGILGLAGRYSYKALQRMDEEWEDYQWQLQKYEKQKAAQEETTFRNLAVDLGSMYTKVAWSDPRPELVVTREGDRQLFNGIVYDKDTNEPIQTGRAALDKYYYGDDTPVTLPWNLLHSPEASNSETIIRDVLQSFLMEALDRLDHQSDSNATLRLTATLPTELLTFRDFPEFTNLLKTEHETILVPDPVAAIWGAQVKGLLPIDDDSHSRILVIDVGGIATQLAIVEKDKVVSSSMIPWGGETLVELAVDCLVKDSQSPLNDGRSLSALQIHARNAVHELSSKLQAKIHVPYLFADPKQHHLDTNLSRSVLEQSIQDDIREHLVESIPDLLSIHMSSPTTLTTLWASVITQLLEQSGTLPQDIDHVLLIGGGSKFRMIPESLQEVLYMLSGADASKKFILPESSLRTELVALGAATMLPSFHYSLEEGLVRNEY